MIEGGQEEQQEEEEDIYLEGAHQCLVHRHHPSGVIKLSTVVGGREQSDKLPFGEKLVTVFDNLEGLCCVIMLLVSMFPPRCNRTV